MDLHDPRVAQPGGDLRLEQESRAIGGRRLAAGDDHLQGDFPIQLGLSGQVNDPHAAPAQFPGDLIPVDHREDRLAGIGTRSLTCESQRVFLRGGRAGGRQGDCVRSVIFLGHVRVSGPWFRVRPEGYSIVGR